MHMNCTFLLLASALLLAACAQSGQMPFADCTPPAAQASALPPAGPISLTMGGSYSAAAGFTTR